MLMTVAQARQYIETELTDQVLTDRLSALELAIRAYTNNNFQIRAIRSIASIKDGEITVEEVIPLHEGDTIQISKSGYNSGLYTVASVDSDLIHVVEEGLIDELEVLVTLVRYPKDIQIGACNMLKYELENREKAGIQSETLSRHTVTYINGDDGSAVMGYPRMVVGFLDPYKKARF